MGIPGGYIPLFLAFSARFSLFCSLFMVLGVLANSETGRAPRGARLWAAFEPSFLPFLTKSD